MKVLSCLFLVVNGVLAIGQNATIGFQRSSGGLKLAGKGSYAQIVLDGADWPGVLRAANDLALDFGRVTGVNGSLMLNGGRPAPSNLTLAGGPTKGSKAGVIIAGTIGKSPLIDALVKDKRIDVAAIAGKWEAFTSTIVKSPSAGIPEALVIAGSDKRGTIYGLYDISEQIGVSPWYWFADVPPKTHDEIYALSTTKVQGSPSVKYRGFFVNDEAPALTGHVKAKYGGQGYISKFYVNVFELLLRSRANYLWPAMWGNMFNVDDPMNQFLADEFGIVMGTSHTEPMMRATKEWSVFGTGPWQWTENNATIYPFFEEGAKRTKNYEGVVTVGMRGYHDTAMSGDIVTEQLENVVKAQREIIKNVWGNESAVPQSWCLYKEVQGYYEAGMTVPDDIILLWTDDNYGNIRRLPVANETSRKGGAGVYYHFDYVGDPRSYKWINTVNLQKTWEQMSLAYMRQARDLWVVNVGDIKGVEIPISHFFDLAYDVNAWGADSIPKWLELWAAREFGSKVAKDVSQLMNTYSKLVGRRKFELVDGSTYSLINYEEADKVLKEWTTLAEQAESINRKLDEKTKPAFFELVLHPVKAGANLYDIHISAARNRLYAGQWRNSANEYADRVREKFDLDRKLTKDYNTMLNGKWAHIMDQTHLNYAYWQQPMRQFTPPIQYVQSLERSLMGDMGVSVEGSNATIPGDDQWHENSSSNLKLPNVDPYSPERWIDIFQVGTQAFTWTIQAEPWVKLSKKTGSLSPSGRNTDVRVYVSVDWAKAPSDSGSTTLNITSSNDYGAQFGMPTVTLPYNRTSVPSSFKAGFVESGSYVSIEAEHYTRSMSSDSAKYVTLPDYGRTLSGVTLNPISAPSQSIATGARLEYDFYTFNAVTNPLKAVNATVILGTSTNYNPDQPLRYAIQIDDQPAKTVAYIKDQPKNIDPNPVGWLKAVADAAWTSVVKLDTLPAGAHTLKLWALEPGVIVEKIILDLGGVKPSYLGPPESFKL